MIGYQMVKKF